MAWGTNLLNYGEPKLKVQFVFNYDDGTQMSVPADMSWKAKTSPITQNNVYRGEVYDARLEDENWATNDYSSWNSVVEFPGPGPETILMPQTMVSERAVREVNPMFFKRIIEPDGEKSYMYNFGENITGWIRLKIKAKKGTSLRIEFAEKINNDGTLFRTSVGNEVNGTVQVDYYTAKGDDEEIWEPRFTFHGFQHAALYVQEGQLLEEPNIHTLKGVVVHSDLPTAGSFSCSDEQLNRLHRAAIRSLSAGMHGIPMDCPVRERCGWTGDAHIMSKVIDFNFDASNFLHKYVQDMETGGREESNEPRVGPYNNEAINEIKPMHIPHMIAPGKRRCGAASSDWGSATVFIPWDIYCSTGDKRILSEMYAMMQNWVEYLLERRNDEGLLDYGLGDWCAPSPRRSAEDGSRWIGNKEIPVTSSIMLIRCCRLMKQIAVVKGMESDAQYYDQLYNDLSEKLMSNYFQTEKLKERSQTAISLAVLNVKMSKEEEKILRCCLIAKTEDGAVFDTGIYGTAPMLEVLRQEGRGDIARKLLTKPEYPSYRSMLDMGAITFWEYWPTKGLKGGYDTNDGSMSHPMHAGFDEWFYAGVAGLGHRNNPIEPRNFTWNDDPVLEWAEASRSTIFGEIKSRWSRTDKTVNWEIVIPEGQEGNISLPSTPEFIYESGKSITEIRNQGADWLKATHEKHINSGGVQVLHIGSGVYNFVFELENYSSLVKIDDKK